MLLVLGLIDVVMISNLLIMVIVGGYETFVSRLDLEGHPDQPEWLTHVNANVLKMKLAMAIIGISSIHLLRTFIEAEAHTEKALLWQTVIHITFLLSGAGARVHRPHVAAADARPRCTCTRPPAARRRPSRRTTRSASAARGRVAARVGLDVARDLGDQRLLATRTRPRRAGAARPRRRGAPP